MTTGTGIKNLVCHQPGPDWMVVSQLIVVFPLDEIYCFIVLTLWSTREGVEVKLCDWFEMEKKNPVDLCPCLELHHLTLV